MEYQQITIQDTEEENAGEDPDEMIKEYDDLKLGKNLYKLKIIFNGKNVNFRLTEKKENYMPLFIYTNNYGAKNLKLFSAPKDDKIMLLSIEKDSVIVDVNSNRIKLIKKEFPISEQLEFLADSIKSRDKIILNLKKTVEENKKEIQTLRDLLNEKTEEIDDIYNHIKTKDNSNKLEENNNIDDILTKIKRKEFQKNDESQSVSGNWNQDIIKLKGKEIILLNEMILKDKNIIEFMQSRKSRINIDENLRKFNKIKRIVNKYIIRDYNEFEEFRKKNYKNLLWIEPKIKKTKKRIFFFDNLIYFEEHNIIIQLNNDFNEYIIDLGYLDANAAIECLMNFKEIKDYYYNEKNFDEDNIKKNSSYSPLIHSLVINYLNNSLSGADFLLFYNKNVDKLFSILFTQLHNEHIRVKEKIKILYPFYEKGLCTDNLDSHKIRDPKILKKEVSKNIIPFLSKNKTMISELFLFSYFFEKSCENCSEPFLADVVFSFIFDINIKKIIDQDKSEDELLIEDFIESSSKDETKCFECNQDIIVKRIFITHPYYLIINTDIQYMNKEKYKQKYIKLSNFLNLQIEDFEKNKYHYSLYSFILNTKCYCKNIKENKWYYSEKNKKELVQDINYMNIPKLLIYKIK